jgi:hypothetical protein
MAPPPEQAPVDPSSFTASSPSSIKTKGTQWQISISPGGFASLSSSLSSNLGIGGPYAGHSTFVNSLQYGLSGSGVLTSFLKTHLSFYDARLSEVPFTRSPNSNIPSHTLAVSQTQAEGQISVGHQIQSIWTGLILGVQYFQHKYKPVDYAYSLLPTHTFINGQVGVDFNFNLDSVIFDLNGGILLPLSYTTAPSNIALWRSIGYWSTAVVHFKLSSLLSIGLYGRFIWQGIDYTGSGSYKDQSYTPPQGFTKASGPILGMSSGLNLTVNF